MEQIPTTLRTTRRIKETPLLRLAVETGVSKSRLHRLETGRGFARVTPEEAARIAEALETPIEDLFRAGGGDR